MLLFIWFLTFYTNKFPEKIITYRLHLPLMRRIFIVTMLLTALIVTSLSLLLFHSYQPSTSDIFNTYQNDAYGIRIDYPKSWEKVDFPGGELLVGFVTTNKNDTGLPESIVLQTIESESYNGLSSRDLASKAVSVYKSQIPDFRLITSSPYETPSGLEGYKIEYSHSSKNLKIDTLEVWTINGDGDDLYRIIFSSDNNEYSTYLKTVNKMIDSFKVEHGLQPASNI